MEKVALPSHRHQASVHSSLQLTTSTHRDHVGEETPSNAAEATSPRPAPGDPTGSHTATSQDVTPRIDRTVRTRMYDRITLSLPLADETVGLGEQSSLLRGWRSPHGEPYRPLGNPNLRLKCSPRLHGDPQAARETPVASTSAKDATAGTRAATSVGPPPQAKPPPAAHVLDMFPRSLRKRPPDDRLVKLALKLQDSIAQYSPDKMRGLRRSHHPVTILQHPQEQEDDDVHAMLLRLRQEGASASLASSGGTHSPPRVHEHGDTSFLLLRGAVHNGEARLQLVRNGQNFLGAIPSGKDEVSTDLLSLKRKYDSAREKYYSDLAAHKASGMSSPSIKPVDEGDSDEGEDVLDGLPCHPPDKTTAGLHNHTLHASDAADSRLYLPYTTREPQQSRLDLLPTLSEFKAKAREERLPLRSSLMSARASTMGESPRKPMSPRSAGGSPARSRRTVQAIEALAPASPMKRNRIQSRRGSVVLAASARRSSTVTGSIEPDVSTPPDPLDPDSDALARAVASYSLSMPDACPPSPSPPRLHSVERLQKTVEAVESAKHTLAQTLAETLLLLDQDRRACLETKFRHLDIRTQWELDVAHMRSAAELERIVTSTHNVASYGWYLDLLRHLLASRERSRRLHPAELFCLDVIRSTAGDGLAFARDELFQLVRLIHADDVAIPHVQQILTFMKRVLGISKDDWAAFFSSQHLPEPVELFKLSEEVKLKDKKKQQRLAKLRSVVRVHQVLRKLTMPTASSSLE